MTIKRATACLSLAFVLSLTASQEKSTLPHRAEVVPGKLYVTVYAHEIETLDVKIPCWSFVSEGLERYGQHEIIFSLRRPRSKTWENFSRELFKMFEVIHGYAEQGQRIEAYDGSILAKEALFLGQKGTWGLIYVPAEMFDGVEVPFEALAAVLIKGDEIEVMSKSSAFRVASLLGAKYRYYPCPPWSDPSRKPVVLAKEFAKSILSQVDHVRMLGLTVRHTFPQDKKSVIALRIEGTALLELNSLLAGLPDKGAIALLTDPDPEATMRFSWMPAVGKTGVIFANMGPWVTGCFVLLVFGEGMEDRGNEIEDGIGLILSPASWNKLKASIASVQPMAIPLGKEGRTLKTEFIHTVAVDPLAPNPFVPSIFTLFQSQEEFISRLVDVSSLKEYVQLFERKASSALAGVPQGDACGFLIAVGIKPGKKTMVWCEAVEGSLPEETLKKLETVLGNIPPIEVKDGPVAFMLEGVLWGRTVNTFPKFPSAWSKALVASGRPFSSLDEFFKIIWPDSFFREQSAYSIGERIKRGKAWDRNI